MNRLSSFASYIPFDVLAAPEAHAALAAVAPGGRRGLLRNPTLSDEVIADLLSTAEPRDYALVLRHRVVTGAERARLVEHETSLRLIGAFLAGQSLTHRELLTIAGRVIGRPIAAQLGVQLTIAGYYDEALAHLRRAGLGARLVALALTPEGTFGEEGLRWWDKALMRPDGLAPAGGRSLSTWHLIHAGCTARTDLRQRSFAVRSAARLAAMASASVTDAEVREYTGLNVLGSRKPAQRWWIRYAPLIGTALLNDALEPDTHAQLEALVEQAPARPTGVVGWYPQFDFTKHLRGGHAAEVLIEATGPCSCDPEDEMAEFLPCGHRGCSGAFMDLGWSAPGGVYEVSTHLTQEGWPVVASLLDGWEGPWSDLAETANSLGEARRDTPVGRGVPEAGIRGTILSRRTR